MRRESEQSGPALARHRKDLSHKLLPDFGHDFLALRHRRPVFAEPDLDVVLELVKKVLGIKRLPFDDERTGQLEQLAEETRLEGDDAVHVRCHPSRRALPFVHAHGECGGGRKVGRPVAVTQEPRGHAELAPDGIRRDLIPPDRRAVHVVHVIKHKAHHGPVVDLKLPDRANKAAGWTELVGVLQEDKVIFRCRITDERQDHFGDARHLVELALERREGARKRLERLTRWTDQVILRDLLPGGEGDVHFFPRQAKLRKDVRHARQDFAPLIHGQVVEGTATGNAKPRFGQDPCCGQGFLDGLGGLEQVACRIQG